MKIDYSFASSIYQDIVSNFSKKLEKNEEVSAKSITNSYLVEYQKLTFEYTQTDINKQTKVWSLADIGYKGKAIGDLNPAEAKELVSNDGFFGVDQTSKRIADFVLMGAGDNVEMLKAGRDGILQGFNSAEELWGSKLPEISYTTIDKAVSLIDARLSELGASIVDTKI